MSKGERMTEPTPEELRAAVETQLCPWCGEGPWQLLARHTQAAHGVAAAEFRERAELGYREPLCSSEFSSMARERELRHLATPQGRDRMKRMLQLKLARPSQRNRPHRRIPRERHLAAMRTPEERARRAANPPRPTVLTPGVVQTIAERLKRGETGRGIARDLGMDPTTVRSTGLVPKQRKVPKAEYGTIRRRRGAGETATAIAADYGVHMATISLIAPLSCAWPRRASHQARQEPAGALP